MKALFNDTVIAESDTTIIVEGNHYFSPEGIHKEYFQASDTHTTCPWKGKASYYDITIDGNTCKDCGWYYPDPSDAAHNIKNYVAFGDGVHITE